MNRLLKKWLPVMIAAPILLVPVLLINASTIPTSITIDNTLYNITKENHGYVFKNSITHQINNELRIVQTFSDKNILKITSKIVNLYDFAGKKLTKQFYNKTKYFESINKDGTKTLFSRKDPIKKIENYTNDIYEIKLDIDLIIVNINNEVKFFDTDFNLKDGYQLTHYNGTDYIEQPFGNVKTVYVKITPNQKIYNISQIITIGNETLFINNKGEFYDASFNIKTEYNFLKKNYIEKTIGNFKTLYLLSDPTKKIEKFYKIVKVGNETLLLNLIDKFYDTALNLKSAYKIYNKNNIAKTVDGEIFLYTMDGKINYTSINIGNNKLFWNIVNDKFYDINLVVNAKYKILTIIFKDQSIEYIEKTDNNIKTLYTIDGKNSTANYTNIKHNVFVLLNSKTLYYLEATNLNGTKTLYLRFTLFLLIPKNTSFEPTTIVEKIHYWELMMNDGSKHLFLASDINANKSIQYATDIKLIRLDKHLLIATIGKEKKFYNLDLTKNDAYKTIKYNNITYIISKDNKIKTVWTIDGQISSKNYATITDKIS